MRRSQLTVIAIAFAVLSAIGVTAGPAAQAAANCTNVAFGPAGTALGRPAPVGTPYSCAIPVHPGASISVGGSHGGGGGGCTANFVFTGGGNTYLGTAGHCTLAASNVSGDVGEFSSGFETATVKDANKRLIGRVVYAIQQGNRDFALIRLEPGIVVDRAMPHWGAVTGMYTNEVFAPAEVRWVGHGVGVGSVVYARSGAALYTTNSAVVNYYGVSAPGDSGGPVVDSDGKAVGVNVGIGVAVGGPGIITRLAPQLARAASVLGINITLAT